MKTAVISYRVADFLKQYPPFQWMEESDLVEIAGRGRVRFHESDEYVCWQGEDHGSFIWVIQQGTVSLWEETDGEETLRDIRGAGDLIGIERYAGAQLSQYAAKTTSDVVLYALDAASFSGLLEKYPRAKQYVAAHATASADYLSAGSQRSAHATMLSSLARQREALSCPCDASLGEAVRRMTAAGAAAVAIRGEDGAIAGVLSASDVLDWVAGGGGNARVSAIEVIDRAPCVVAPDTTVSDCVLAMAESGVHAAAITNNGERTGQLYAVVTATDLAPLFGDQPDGILHEIEHAPGVDFLRDLVERARAFVLGHLTAPPASDWLARFVLRVDTAVLARVVQSVAPPPVGGYCWCFLGAAGRGESTVPVLPESMIVVADSDQVAEFAEWRQRVESLLRQCGYLDNQASSGFETCESLASWTSTFRNWVDSPVLSQAYLARPFFDARPVGGDVALYHRLESEVLAQNREHPEFVEVLAHDCLANLPPLTFFRDAVVEESGEHADVFRLEQSALRPLVDVGRVYGLAANQTLGSSTLERLGLARRRFPEKETIFREAADTLRVVLYQQARAGIRRHTDGAEISPEWLSRHERQLLKSGFRAILRLLEFTAERSWLETWR